MLFSQLEKNSNKNLILDQIFPKGLSYKKLAFIPANGLTKCKPKYLKMWKKVAENRKITLTVVDIGEDCKFPTIERQKVLHAEIVVISGGDTLELARLFKKWKVNLTLQKFIPVATVAEMKVGKVKKLLVNKRVVAMFYSRGNFYAIQNNCPHQNGDLADGYIKDGKIYCPLHNWSFDLETGSYTFNAHMKLRVYDIRIENDTILIALPED